MTTLWRPSFLNLHAESPVENPEKQNSLEFLC